jgi:hypothetical protein
VRDHRYGKKRCVDEVDHAEAYQQDCSYYSLKQKTDTRPTIGERRIESLQCLSLRNRKGIAEMAERLKVAGGDGMNRADLRCSDKGRFANMRLVPNSP